MTNNFSYSDVEARLKAFADGHYIIKRYSVGEATDFEQTANPDESNAALWPLMHVIHPQVTLAEGAVRFELEVLFADLPREFEERNTEQVEVLSNLIRLCQDLGAAIKNTPYILSDSASIEGDIRIETIGRARFNSVCVTRLLATIELPYDWNACDIPANFVFGQASGGGGWPWPFPPTGDWCDKLVYCPVTQYILQELEDKLSFVSVDGTTIIGDGTPTNPLQAIGGGGGGAVASVNGQTGVVVLGAGDVGADPVGSAAQAEQNANNYTDTELQNYVQSVTGLDTDNTDPQNPVVQVAVDGVTITGSGTSADPLVSVGGGVASVTGESVDNTDPVNPVVNAWPLAGTGTGPKANGTIEVDPTFSGDLIKQDDGAGTEKKLQFTPQGTRLRQDLPSGDNAFFFTNGNNIGFSVTSVLGPSDEISLYVNQYADVATYPIGSNLMGQRWNFNGLAAPTVNDDASLGYGVDSGFIHDGTLYICTDASTGAAVWVAQGGGVQSVTGNIVDITDPDNPVVDQVQADWNQANSAAVDFIKNKPTIVSGILWVPVSTSLTAANKTFYVNIASATYTDPTGADGEFFEVVVEAGTATVGGVGYSVRGTRIVRVFNSSVWTSYVYSPGGRMSKILSGNFSTTSDTFTDVTPLEMTLEANKNYSFRFTGQAGCDNTGGSRFGFTIPSGALMSGYFIGRGSGVTAVVHQGLAFPATTESSLLTNQNTTFGGFTYEGTIIMGGTAGTVTPRWRSNVNTQESTLFAGFIFKIEEE